MVRVSTVIENGTTTPFEVKLESSCGVHTVLKSLAPQEKFTLERSSSDTYSQHWVVMGSALVISFSSDELIDNDTITIVKEGPNYRKVMSPRVYKSHSMPNRRSPYVNPEDEEGSGSYMYSACKPPLRKSFKKLFYSLIGRSGSEDVAMQDESVPTPLHLPNRLHSI